MFGLQGLLSHFFSFRSTLKLIKIIPFGLVQPSPSSPRLPVWGPVQSDLPVRPDRTKPYPSPGPSGLVESLFRMEAGPLRNTGYYSVCICKGTESPICCPCFLHASVLVLLDCQESVHPDAQRAWPLFVEQYEPVSDFYLWCQL